MTSVLDLGFGSIRMRRTWLQVEVVGSRFGFSANPKPHGSTCPGFVHSPKAGAGMGSASPYLQGSGLRFSV